MTTQIYSFRLNTADGIKTGRVEAKDCIQARVIAVQSVNSEVIWGNIRLLENQKVARKAAFIALKAEHQLANADEAKFYGQALQAEWWVS